MKGKRNNINTINIKKGKTNNWKSGSKRYLQELEEFLDKTKEILDEELRKEILMQMLRCDNELTLLSEKLFKEYYNQGFQEGDRNKEVSC